MADPVAASWHAKHYFADPPAVVEVRIPLSRIQDAYQSAVPTDEAAILAIDATEVTVAFPVPAEWVVDYEVVPRRVDFVAAAGLLGLTTAELAQRVETGEIAGCKVPEVPGNPWYWKLDDLMPFLSSAFG